MDITNIPDMHCGTINTVFFGTFVIFQGFLKLTGWSCEINLGTIRNPFYHALASKTAARLKAISGSSGESEAAILENNSEWSYLAVVMLRAVNDEARGQDVRQVKLCMRWRGLSGYSCQQRDQPEKGHILVCASALVGCSAIDSFQAEIASSNSSV